MPAHLEFPEIDAEYSGGKGGGGDSGGYAPRIGVQTVTVDNNGQLGTVVSSRRYKRDIRDMGDASGANGGSH